MKSKRERELEKCLEKTLKELDALVKINWGFPMFELSVGIAFKRAINRIQRVLKGVAK